MIEQYESGNCVRYIVRLHSWDDKDDFFFEVFLPWREKTNLIGRCGLWCISERFGQHMYWFRDPETALMFYLKFGG